MSAQHLEVLDTTLQKTHQWIDAISEAAHTDRHTAYQALRAVLQTLRDRLPAAEAAHLSAQLPLLVRGIFYEGYRPTEVPVTLSREEFLAHVKQKMVSTRTLDPLALTRQVLATIDHLLGEGELEKVEDVLPGEIRTLFPQRSTRSVR